VLRDPNTGRRQADDVRGLLGGESEDGRAREVGEAIPFVFNLNHFAKAWTAFIVRRLAGAEHMK